MLYFSGIDGDIIMGTQRNAIIPRNGNISPTKKGNPRHKSTTENDNTSNSKHNPVQQSIIPYIPEVNINRLQNPILVPSDLQSNHPSNSQSHHTSHKPQNNRREFSL